MNKEEVLKWFENRRKHPIYKNSEEFEGMSLSYANLVFAHYGLECQCCGENKSLHFLTIDHVNNDGAVHRKSLGTKTVYKWLVNNNFPSGFQALCWNCNCGKSLNNGLCPHKG